MLEAVTPANISICLYSMSALSDLVGGQEVVLPPEENVADTPRCIAKVPIQLNAVV